jgi:RNA polymerase sigma-70 factor (ECF subfamily)
MRRTRQTDHFPQIFNAGALGGLPDRELLARFTAGDKPQAELAFEVMVRRHGPMVLGVCRGVLGGLHDAQDAFQATFLVLARKSASLRSGDSVAGWLHGVARRVAWRTRRESARRRMLETVAAELAGARQTVSNASESAELRDELDALPSKFRLPLELCYLHGLTHDEAASRLGCPVGTVRSRLARGRDALRARLTRRGLLAPAGSLGELFAGHALAETVPPALADATIRAVMVPSGASTRAIGLMKGALATMTRIQLFRAATLAVAAGVLAGGVTLARPQGKTADRPTPQDAAAAPNPNTPDELQGAWVRVSTEVGGKVTRVAPADPPVRLVVRDAVFDFGGDGRNLETFVLFPGEKPSRIVLTPRTELAGPAKDKPYAGIYKVEGDTLTLCLKPFVADAPPTEFSTKPGDNAVLDVYRRERPAKAAEDPVKAELKKFQGRWRRVASEASGQDFMPRGSIDPNHPALVVIFDGNQWRGLREDGSVTEPYHTVVLNPTTTPKQIFLAIPPDPNQPAPPSPPGYRAIYKLDGDALTLCIQFNSDKPAPTDFTTKVNDGRVLDVYQRDKR